MKNLFLIILLLFILSIPFRCTYKDTSIEPETPITKPTFAEVASKDTDAIKKIFIFNGRERFDSVSSVFYISRTAGDTIASLLGVKIDCLFQDEADYLSIFRIYENLDESKYTYKGLFGGDTLKKKFVIDPGSFRKTLDGRWADSLKYTIKSYYDEAKRKTVYDTLRKDTVKYIRWNKVSSVFKGWCGDNQNKNPNRQINLKLRFVFGKDTAYRIMPLMLVDPR